MYVIHVSHICRNTPTPTRPFWIIHLDHAATSFPAETLDHLWATFVCFSTDKECSSLESSFLNSVV
jgi:hypothetical protein